MLQKEKKQIYNLVHIHRHIKNSEKEILKTNSSFHDPPTATPKKANKETKKISKVE